MDQDEAMAKVEEALEAKGLHTYRLSDSIMNVHSAPVGGDGSGDDMTYIATVTVTITP